MGLKNEQFDIIYLDPPYATNYIYKAIEKIIKLSKNNMIISCNILPFDKVLKNNNIFLLTIKFIYIY